MFSVQPIQLWRYIGFKRNKIPRNLRRLFYLSWEDALWDLLDKKKIPKSSYILIPNFYCGDVERNIICHGYKIVRYPISKNMTVSENKFRFLINKYQPKVVIIFHPVGILSNLSKDRKWVKSLSDDILLIEDGVHRIVNSQKIKIFKKNHFIIDSLRKVVPLQGSNIYGNKEDLDYDSLPFYQSINYSIRVHTLWLVMLIFLNLGFYRFAEQLMVKGYDLIGDAKKSAPGFILFKYIFEFINFEKIYKIKYHQVKIYNEYFINELKYKSSDKGELRGFPLIVDNLVADRVLNKIRSSGLMIRFELNDSEWSQGNKIIYLPLGPYLNDNDIHEISKLVLKSFEYE